MSTVALTDDFDPGRAEAFASRMLEIINSGSLALMTSIGHQTGLFDTLAGLPPSTSAEIATAAGLQERYVREWLGAMVVGRIVEYDGTTRRYWLPAEHVPSVTRSGGIDNLAFFTQYVTLLSSVEQGIIDCFRNGGGLPYSAYPRFQKVQAEETARVYDASLVDRILTLAPGIVERLREGIAVADVGTGCGHAVNVMARAFPRSTFTGYDISAEGVSAGRGEAREMGLENVRFEVKDLAELDAASSYDLITAFDTIHDQVKPRVVLQNIGRALRPGGVLLMADIAAATDLTGNLDHPLGATLYTISCTHCMTVSLAHGGEGLGAMWGKEMALEYLAAAGFGSVDVKQVDGDPINLYFIARPH